MLLKKNIISILIISSIPLFFSCSDSGGSIRVKNWKILYDQDPSFESVVKKTGWQDVKIPSSFKLPYPAEKKFQFIWLKGDFEVRGDPAEQRGISTGRMRLTDKTFINNYIIGSVPPEEAGWNPFPRNYIIPENIIIKGNNAVYIMIGAYGGQFCGITDDVLIQNQAQFMRTALANKLIYLLIPFGILILYIGFLLQSLISFVLNRKEKLYIYLSLVLLILGIFIFISLPLYKLASFEFFHAIRMACLITCSALIIMFIQSMYRLYFSNYNRIIIPLLLIFSAIILTSSSTSYFNLISRIFVILNYIILIPYFIFIIYMMGTIKRRDQSGDKFMHYAMIASPVFCSFIVISETYIDSRGGQYSGLIVTFVPPLCVIFLAIFMAREIMKRQLELDLLYDKLKENAGGITITEASEEKLKMVIAFIDDNFTSDISREGLAAAVDLNPSYMSTLFKSYKGMTINNYINQLRIQNAIGQLELKNSRIIDIAFSVGFENIVSFNRVFKKITGKTPSEYKYN
ncbi:MAG: AraC family transcriptional regulator, partial [Spirochaetes bacterium]|nr:AraC family transcriptional regulator [Spirochaetota bacterium]